MRIWQFRWEHADPPGRRNLAAERHREQPCFPPGPVRLGGSGTLRPCSWQLQGLNNESVPELRGQVQIVSEIWREEGACQDLPTQCVAVVNGRFGQGHDELCKQGKSITAVTFVSPFLVTKMGWLHCRRLLHGDKREELTLHFNPAS